MKKQITPEIREQLEKPFPPEAVTQHPTKTFLSTIKAIYVTERLNDVFGIGRWNLSHKVVERTDDYVLVSGRLILLDYDCVFPVQYGGHTTVGKNVEIADGYKSAVTDLMSKCASYLHIGLDVFKGKAQVQGVGIEHAPVPTTYGVITEAQRKRLYAIYKESQMDENDLKMLYDLKGYSSSKDIKKSDYDEIVKAVLEFRKPNLNDILKEREEK